MDFRQIEAFAAVAKCKSFSKAADEIYLSQPTVSTHVASLENELGVPLFNRNGKEISLTPYGKIFFEYALNLINIRNSALTNISNYNNSVSGELKIAASTTPLRYLLPGLIKSFREVYDDILFDIKEGSTSEVVDFILNGDVEIGLVGEKYDDDKISYLSISEDNLILIGNIKGIEGELSLKSLVELPFILREKGSATRNTFEKFLLSKGYSINKLNIAIEASSLEAILQMVKNGLGISIVSEIACRDYIDAGFIKKIEIKDFLVKRDIYMISHKKRSLSPGARAFYEHISSKHNI